jgi:hypothetical protein
MGLEFEGCSIGGGWTAVAAVRAWRAVTPNRSPPTPTNWIPTALARPPPRPLAGGRPTQFPAGSLGQRAPARRNTRPHDAG